MTQLPGSSKAAMLNVMSIYCTNTTQDKELSLHCPFFKCDPEDIVNQKTLSFSASVEFSYSQTLTA